MYKLPLAPLTGKVWLVAESPAETIQELEIFRYLKGTFYLP